MVSYHILGFDGVRFNNVFESFPLVQLNLVNDRRNVENLKAVDKSHCLNDEKVDLFPLQGQNVGEWNEWNEIIDKLPFQVSVGYLSQISGRNCLAILGEFLEELKDDGAEENEFKVDHELE